MNEARDGGSRARRCSVEPPRLAEWLLRRMLPDDAGESVGGDLEEIFQSRIVPGAGRFRAAVWYWRQVFFSLRLLLRFRGNPKSALESWKGRIRPENPRAGEYRSILSQAALSDDSASQIVLVKELVDSGDALVARALAAWRVGELYIYAPPDGTNRTPFLNWFTNCPVIRRLR